MPVTRAGLLFCALANLLLGRREAADRRFSEMLRRWPADAYALAGRAHLRAEQCRRAEALAEARWLASYDLARFECEGAEPAAAQPARPRQRGCEPAARRPVAAPLERETGLAP